MAEKIQTLILRFRDLLSQDTILEHKKIIQEQGRVWWGWWAKPQEKVPVNEFNYLRGLCRKPGGLTVFLFDSGDRCLYQAACSDIHYSNGDLVPSPEPERTPEYYCTSTYIAWFRFTSISCALQHAQANEELQKLTYIQVDDLFVSGHSPYAPFYGKRVYSVDELQEQQRTAWFVRSYQPGDKIHEIHSYSPAMASGKNIETDFKLMRTNRLLWLSDLHFSAGHHAFQTAPGNDNRLSIRLKHELDALLPDSACFAIVSGDLTYASQEDEFHLAEGFISDLNSIYQLDERSYAICPGNHDMRLSSTGYKEDDIVTVAAEESKENYVRFYKQVFGIEPTDSLYSIKRLLTPDMTPVEIIAVNTCLLQQGEHFMGMGFVGNDQLASIERDLAFTKGKPILRILVMHHHLLPVAYSEKPAASPMYSMMLDSEAVSQFAIRNKIGLILHGHTHKEYYSEVIRYGSGGERQKFYVVGLGSTGAVNADLSDGSNNMFAVLSFSKDALEISQYDIKASGEPSQAMKTYQIPLDDLIGEGC